MTDQQPPRKAPPPRRSGQGGRPAPSRAAAPRRPAHPRSSRRRQWWRTRPAAAVAAVSVVAAAAVIVAISSGGGSSGPSALHYRVGTLEVYGAKGPEGIPLESGPVLAPPDPSLSGAPVDGVQCGATEQLASHTHTHLSIFVDGQPRSVPLAVGMVPPASITTTAAGRFAQGSSTCLYWLHTHAQDGIIHVEAPAAHQYVLGQFFDLWGQPLSPMQVGPAKGIVSVTVDGKPFAGDPRNAPLDAHGQIVLNVGTPVVSPPAISFSGSGL